MGYIGDGAQDLVLELCFRHYRAGAASWNWRRNGELLHPGNPDKDLDVKAARKIAKYRELYRDHRRHLDFLPAIASTSRRIHCELLRLPFLHALHCFTDTEVKGVPIATHCMMGLPGSQVV